MLRPKTLTSVGLLALRHSTRRFICPLVPVGLARPDVDAAFAGTEVLDLCHLLLASHEVLQVLEAVVLERQLLAEFGLVRLRQVVQPQTLKLKKDKN